ncbi:MAG: hypothetical protein NC336_10015, partial [Clostridium sp.]|nr:hypothetical protein [Clostridium sp.]
MPSIPTDFISKPSAGPEAIQRYIDFPVLYASGTMDVALPLVQWSVGALPMQISIGYHTGGVKYRQQSSPVGLGWALNAGGCIIREVNGLPDELPQKKMLKSWEPIDAYFLIDGFRNQRDTGYDRYRYSFNGHSGSFYIIDGHVQMFPENGLKVTRTNLSDDLGDFAITDLDGNTYEFTFRERHRRNISSEHESVSYQGSGVYADYEFVAAWHLERIIVPASADTVRLEYRTLPQFSRSEGYTWAATVSTKGNVVAGYGSSAGTSVRTTYINEPLLSAVRSRTATVSLDWRERGRRYDSQNSRATLRSVTLSNHAGRQVRRCELNLQDHSDRSTLLTEVRYVSDGEIVDWRRFEYNPMHSDYRPDFWGYLSRRPEKNAVAIDRLCKQNTDLRADSTSMFDGMLVRISDMAGTVTSLEYEPSRHRLDPGVTLDDLRRMRRSMGNTTGEVNPGFEEGRDPLPPDIIRPVDHDLNDSIWGDKWWNMAVIIGPRLRRIHTQDQTIGRERWRRFIYEQSCPSVDYTRVSASHFITISGYIKAATYDDILAGAINDYGNAQNPWTEHEYNHYYCFRSATMLNTSRFPGKRP